MTDQEIRIEQERAEDLAKAVGGTLAIILGLRPSDWAVTWDRTRARFVIDGRFVSLATIRREMRKFGIAVRVRMTKLANRLAAGTIDLATWRKEMKELVASSHVVMAALAAGSIERAARNKTVQDRIESEQEYADGFAADIQNKKLSTPTIKARSSSYLLAAAVTFAIVGLAVHKLAGYTEARRITTAAESCRDCRAYADQWMPIGDIPSIGALQCGSRCKCYMEYR